MVSSVVKRLVVVMVAAQCTACSMQSLVDASLPPVDKPRPFPEPVVVSVPAPVEKVPEEPSKDEEERQISVTGPEKLPPATVALIYKADNFMAQGRPDLAVEQLNRASRISPKAPEVYTGLAKAYHSMGRLQQAQTFANKARSLKPSKMVLIQLVSLGL